MKTTFVIIFILITSISFEYYLRSHKIQTPPVSQMKNIHMVSVASSTRYAIATGEYPQFINVSNDFNVKIKNDIEKGIIEHRKNSEENWKARYETRTKDEHISQYPKSGGLNDERFEYNASTSIVRNDAKVISFIIHIYEFSGGAHGSEAILTFNYDVTKQKEVTLDDIAHGDTQFLKKLSKIARITLRNKLASLAEVPESEINEEMLNSGTEATSTNFSLFTLPRDGEVTFYFTQYQVAAYVFGSSFITVALPLR